MRQQGKTWAPSGHRCYVSIVHAFALQGDPVEGMLIWS